MDCIGSICGDNKISFFGVDNDLCVNIYKSFSPTNIQFVINGINYHPQKDQLICAGTNGIFSVDSQITNQIEQDFDFENKPNTNVSCITTNNQWFGYSSKNIMNVISWNSSKLVTTKKHKEYFNAISFIANRYIIGGDIKGDILIHNCNSHLLSTTFRGYVSQNCINCIDVTKNRINWFIASNDNGFNYLFDITREKIIYYDYSHSSASNQCSFNPIYSSLFVSCGLDKRILVHDINRKKIGIKLETNAPLSCVKYLPESEKHIICCSTHGDIYLYDLRRFTKPIQTIKTAKCIIGLDVHSKLKYSSIDQITKKMQEMEMKIQSETTTDEIITNNININNNNKNNKSPSPISSAVASLPDINKLFLKIKKNLQDTNSNCMDDTNNANNTNDTTESNDTNDTKTKLTYQDTNGVDTPNKDDDILENKIREIVKEEISLSEKRVLKEIGKMMSQLHSDLIEQFITNEISAEKNIEKLFELMTQLKNQNQPEQNILKHARF